MSIPTRLLRAALASLALLVAVPAQAEPSAFERGQTHMQARRWQEAIKAFEEACTEAPDDWRAYHLAGTAHGRLREFRAAEGLLRRAYALNPNAPGVLFDLASTLFNRGKWDESIEKWRALQATTANNATPQQLAAASYYHGTCADRLELQGEAMANLEQAVKLAPENHVYRRMLAGTLLNAGQFEACIPHYEQLLKVQPKNVEHHYLLGTAYSAMSRTEDALRSFEAARKLDPKHDKSWQRAGQILLAQRNYDRAYAYFDQATKANPLSYEGWKGLMTTANRLGYTDEVPRFRAKFEEVYATSRKVEDELRELYREAKDRPQDATVAYKVAMILLQHGRFLEAADWFQKALAFDPSQDIAAINLAQIFAHDGRFEDALLEHDKLLRRRPDHPIALTESASILWRMGKRRWACDRYLKALGGMNTDHPRFLSTLTMATQALFQEKRAGEALPHLERGAAVWEKDPTNYIPIVLTHAQLVLATGSPDIPLGRMEAVFKQLEAGTPAYQQTAQLLLAACQRLGDHERVAHYQRLLQGG